MAAHRAYGSALARGERYGLERGRGALAPVRFGQFGHHWDARGQRDGEEQGDMSRLLARKPVADEPVRPPPGADAAENQSPSVMGRSPDTYTRTTPAIPRDPG